MVEPRQQLRWETVGNDPQARLFGSDLERVTHPEFEGMEFLHVRSKSIINEVPNAAHLPFRYTINVYRGCSHACVYCLQGDTPILMAEGRTKPLADVRAGDQVFGTVRRGRYRRYVSTEVLDHWQTVKPAYRITLADGTELVASGDHRFLAEDGWRHVSKTGLDICTSGTLMTGTRLCGLVRGDLEGGRSPRTWVEKGVETGRELTQTRVRLEGQRVRTSASLAVVSVEPLGIEVPMYDITTGTGDFIANGVVSHNCFARPTHEYLNLSAGEDFERVIVVKVNAVDLLRAELQPRRWAGEHIAMGTNTDPYQRCEGRYELTRGVLEVLTEHANPFSILTKSSLVLRDLDVLAEANERTDVAVNFSVGTLDDEVWRSTEPGTPKPQSRLDAVAKLRETGIRSGVLIAPIIPGISDRRDQLEDVVKACIDAGASIITPITLHLRPGVKEQFMPWLADERPDLLPRYEDTYQRSYAPKRERQRISRLVRDLVREHGGPVEDDSRPNPRNVRSRTAPSPSDASPAHQLSLHDLRTGGSR